MRFSIAILFILLSHSIFAQVDKDSLEQEKTDTVSVKGDSLMYQGELVDEILVESEYSEEKRNRSAELDSIAKIEAPFTIKDPRFVQKGETKYILQDRYLPTGSKFSKWLFDRIDVGVQSGYNMFVPRGNHRFNNGVPVGAYLKFNINRLNALRLGTTYTLHYVEGMGNGLKLNSFDLDYMYNLSSYLYGHNANRLLNVSAVLGAGYVLANFREEKGKGLKALGGLNFDFKLTPSSHLFIEPYFSVVSDQVDLSSTTNEHRWDLMYGVRAGIGVNFNSRNDSLKNVNYNGNLFWEFGQGLTFFPSDGIDLSKSISTSYTVSIGKWLDPFVGIRLSGTFTDYNWAIHSTEQKEYMGYVVVPSYETKLRTVMVGGRLELLLDVLNLFKDYRTRRNPFFSWQLSVGGEFGYMLKDLDRTDVNLKTYYVGFVAGTQLLVSPDEATSLFLEPRILLTNYSLPYRNAPGFREWYSDNIYGLNVGVRVSHPVRSDSQAYAGHFEPKNFAGVALGAFRGEHYTDSWSPDTKFQTNFGLTIGREFAPLLAAKLQVDYQNVHTSSSYRYTVNDGVTFSSPSVFNETYHLLNTKLVYMLDFTNLYQGYRPNRKVNLFMEMGPSYVFVLKKSYALDSKEMAGGTNPTPVISNEDNTKGTFALWGGMACTVKMTDKFSLVLEPHAQLLMRSRIFTGASSALRKNIFMGVNLGVNYNF